MIERERPSETSLPAHERVYRTLRARVMNGQIAPGVALTLRGIAAEFGVSMTPEREAARRLTAEGALKLSASGRVSTPELTRERIDELAALRALLEPELAVRALPRAHIALIDRMGAINGVIDEMIETSDACGYLRANLEFHRTLYLRAQAPAMLGLIETVWLQLGPTMRQNYERLQRRRTSDNHRKIIEALRVGDAPGLRLVIRLDVTQGLQMPAG